jgi:hypothetical protein
MAHKISWHLEKRVLLITYIGNIDLAEVQQINNELELLRLEGQKPIHIISDHRRMGSVEMTLKRAFVSFSAMKRFGWGWVMMIGPDHLLRFFAEVFATQFAVKVRVMESQEEALAMLNKLDLSLHGDSGQS